MTDLRKKVGSIDRHMTRVNIFECPLLHFPIEQYMNFNFGYQKISFLDGF